jgi:hypothetical protein
LSTDEARSPVQVMTGALTANRTIIVPTSYHGLVLVAMLVLATEWSRDSVARRRTVIRLSATP